MKPRNRNRMNTARQSRNRMGNTPHPACGHPLPSSDEGRGQGENAPNTHFAPCHRELERRLQAAAGGLGASCGDFGAQPSGCRQVRPSECATNLPSGPAGRKFQQRERCVPPAVHGEGCNGGCTWPARTSMHCSSARHSEAKPQPQERDLQTASTREQGRIADISADWRVRTVMRRKAALQADNMSALRSQHQLPSVSIWAICGSNRSFNPFERSKA